MVCCDCYLHCQWVVGMEVYVNKIIIENRTAISDEDALELVTKVVREGREIVPVK